MMLIVLVVAILLVFSNASHVLQRPMMIDDEGLFFRHGLISLIRKKDWTTAASTMETCCRLLSYSTANEVMSELIYNAAPPALIFDYLLKFHNPEDLIADLPIPAKFTVGVLASHLKWLDRNAKLFQSNMYSPLEVPGEAAPLSDGREHRARFRKIQRLFQIFDETAKELQSAMQDHRVIPAHCDQLDENELQSVLLQLTTHTESGGICDRCGDQIGARDLALVDCTDHVFCLSCLQRLLEQQSGCSCCMRSVEFLLGRVKRFLQAAEMQEIVAISDQRSRSLGRFLQLVPRIIQKYYLLLPLSVRSNLKPSARFFKFVVFLILLHLLVVIYQLTTKSPWSIVCGTRDNFYVCLVLGLASIVAKMIFGSNSFLNHVLENNLVKI